MMEKLTLKIQGMDCASCAAIIEHDLKKKKGIISASINLASEKLYLEFDPAETNVEDVKKSVKGLGYKALDDNEGMDMMEGHEHSKMEKESEIRKLKMSFVLSLIFGLPVIYMVMGGMLGLAYA